MNTEEKNNTLKHSAITGSIVVTRHNSNQNQRQITSNSKWFDCDYILFDVKEDHISITKPNLDYRGKVHRPTKQNNRYHFSVRAELPFGKFEIDADESTEDELVVYYR